MKEIPREALEENQVRVKVSAVGLNPVDYKDFWRNEAIKNAFFCNEIKKSQVYGFNQKSRSFHAVLVVIFQEWLLKLEKV